MPPFFRLAVLVLLHQTQTALAQLPAAGSPPEPGGLFLPSDNRTSLGLPFIDHDEADVAIDGAIDERVWTRIPFINAMRVIVPDTLTEVPHDTDSRLFYTSRGLYLSFDMEQLPATLVQRISTRANLSLNRDRIGMTLDTSGQGLSGYWMMPALGDNQLDGTNLPLLELDGINPRQQWCIFPYIASTAVEVFFPDKRLFFQEGQEIFNTTPRSTGSNGKRLAIVNRPIGARPRQPALLPGVRLPTRERIRPADLLGAVKITGQAGTVRYGVLAAAEDDSAFQVASRRYYQEGRDFTVFRLIYEDSRNAAYRGLGYIGSLVTQPESDTEIRLNFPLRYRWQTPLSDLFVAYSKGDNRSMAIGDFDNLFQNSWDNPLGDQLVIKLRYRFGTG